MEQKSDKNSTDSENSQLLNNGSNNGSYDHYLELSLMRKLSPICVAEQFEYGYNSLHSTISSIRIILLLIMVTQCGMRFDKLFDKKYLKHHWKYYSFLLISTIIMFIMMVIQSQQPLTLSIAVIIYIFGFFCFYIFIIIYFYANINDIFISKYGKVFAIKFFQFYYVISFQIHLIALIIINNSSRNSSFYDEYILLSFYYTFSIGVILISIGAFCQMTAVYAIGFNTYYWFDMVLKIPNSYFTQNSIYKYVSNPIYGLGMLELYGFALIKRSIIGILIAALNHFALYTFYFLNEKPFIKQMYL